jgi:hypothetical protein
MHYLIFFDKTLEFDLVAMHPEALDGLQVSLVICLKKKQAWNKNDKEVCAFYCRSQSPFLH